MITDILASEPRHEDLARLTQIGSEPLLNAPIAPASFLVGCTDGATMAIGYMDQRGFLESMRRKELSAVCIGLRALSEWAYLIIAPGLVCSSDGQKVQGTGWTWASAQGALLAAQELGVQIIQLQHPQQVPDYVLVLAARERGAKRVMPIREALFLTPAEQMLLSIPGLGEERVTALLAHCGTASAALLALTWPGAALPTGFGPKTRDAARLALGLRNDEALVPTALTDLVADKAA